MLTKKFARLPTHFIIVIPGMAAFAPLIKSANIAVLLVVHMMRATLKTAFPSFTAPKNGVSILIQAIKSNFPLLLRSHGDRSFFVQCAVSDRRSSALFFGVLTEIHGRLGYGITVREFLCNVGHTPQRKLFILVNVAEKVLQFSYRHLTKTRLSVILALSEMTININHKTS